MGAADIEREHSCGSGRIDIYLPRFRTIVEVKRAGGNRLPHQALPSHLLDAQGQMERYLGAEIRSEQSRFNALGRPLGAKSWTGILCDGSHWSCWTYSSAGSDPAAGRRPVFSLGPEAQPEQLLDALAGVLDPDPELKAWVPGDPSALFQGRPEALADLYQAMPRQVRPATRTKLALWHDMLRASGLSPSGRAGDESQFALHSFLIAVARLVSHLLSPGDGDWRLCLRDGFASWVLDWDAGEAWAADIWDTVRRYDWRSRRGDVLRVLYERFVSESDRHVFGEFYTPDWLAGMMVERVLDDEWLGRAVPAAEVALQAGRQLAGVGVLDPACGSGTFLYHAVKRILQADEMRFLLPQQQADVAALLVNGIDVHPVAVEVAKATVLRALPAEPRAGAGAVRIFLGDSLLTDEDYSSLFGHREDAMRLETPQGTEFFVPMEFVRRDGFPEAMRRLVLAAVERRPVPQVLLQSVGVEARRDLAECRDALEGAVQSEGNSVWTWYAVNRAAPHLLAERKVDRIVANPPWVKLSSIQEAGRKRAMERLGASLGLQAGGKQAPNLDIAAFFMLRARGLYLCDPEGDPAVWLVKRSALRSGHWRLFRAKHAKHLEQTVDLVKLQPFGGGDARRCCLLAEHTAFLASGEGHGRPPRLSAEVRDSGLGRPAPREGWLTACDRIRLVPARLPPPQVPSDYAPGEFRRGASVFPQVLLQAAKVEAQGSARVRVETQPSSRLQWRSVPPQRVEIPRRWLASLHLSSQLFAFAVARHPARAIIPVDSRGALTLDSAMDEPAWEALDDLWPTYRSRGRSTPATLADRLDYGRALSMQPRLAAPGRSMVLHPKAGDIMRSARVRPGRSVVNDSLYWHLATGAQEAAYLVALLNASSLQTAFRKARSSGRNFDQSPWRKVPIPRFDPADSRHAGLARLCTEAEAEAEAIRDLLPGKGQVKVSGEIRSRLVECGIAARIDALAQQLLPEQATPPGAARH